MIAPERMTEAKARLWLSEATGEEIPAIVQVTYCKPFVYRFDPRDDGSDEQMIRTRNGKTIIEPRGYPVAERYDVANLHGECEDEIPLHQSPFPFRLVPVTSRTRAGKRGKVIVCPHCGARFTVWHFAWCALVCMECGKDFNKNQTKIQEVGEN